MSSSDVTRPGAALAQHPVGLRRADHGQAVLRLPVADRVTTGEQAARLPDLRGGPVEHGPQGRGREVLREAPRSTARTGPGRPWRRCRRARWRRRSRPYSRGSSTRGGKKSTVPSTASWSEICHAAASSGGSRPAINAPEPVAGAGPAPRPASASARTSAPSFAAQPPQSVRSVSLIDPPSGAPVLGDVLDTGR